MGTKLVRLEMGDPPPTRLYCPFTGNLVICAEDPLEIESRLANLSPHLRFVLFYDRTSYPVFWAANPEGLDEEHRKAQEGLIRIWTTAADAEQAEVTMNGGWYIAYLEKIEELLPSSSLLLEINTFHRINVPPNALRNPNLHISWDFSPAYTVAALFISDRPRHELVFKRIKTMWDDFIPDFTPGDSKEQATSDGASEFHPEAPRSGPEVTRQSADVSRVAEQQKKVQEELDMLKAWIVANPPESPYIPDKQILERWKGLPRQRAMDPAFLEQIANAYLAEAKQYHGRQAKSDAVAARVWVWILLAILALLVIWLLL